MADVTIQKDGRKWSVGDGGVKSLKRKYIIVLDSVTAANGEAASFSNVPAIGSAHPSHTPQYPSRLQANCVPAQPTPLCRLPHHSANKVRRPQERADCPMHLVPTQAQIAHLSQAAHPSQSRVSSLRRVHTE